MHRAIGLRKQAKLCGHKKGSTTLRSLSIANPSGVSVNQRGNGALLRAGWFVIAIGYQKYNSGQCC